MKILIAADHAGFEMKKELIPFLVSLGHEVRDFGAETMDPKDDYPDIIMPLARAIAANSLLKGIIIGGSGQGEAIAANRYKGVRAVVYYAKPTTKQIDADKKELDLIVSAKAHNDANVLSLGARFLSMDEAKDAVRNFLQTPFSGSERHVRRIKKLDEI